MKIKRIAILMLAVAFIAGCTKGKYSPSAQEELFGTWLSEGTSEKLVLKSDGTYQVFMFKTDELPYVVAEFTIAGKRIDQEKVIWYQIDLVHKKPYDDKLKELYKISQSNKNLEVTSVFVRDVQKDPYPKEIDKTSSTYKQYTRVQ
jgi:hypothetical protein